MARTHRSRGPALSRHAFLISSSPNDLNGESCSKPCAPGCSNRRAHPADGALDSCAPDHRLERLWPADTFVDFDNGLNTAISKLREVLGDSGQDHRYIETLGRRGYRFVAPVEELGAPATAQRRELDIRRKLIQPDTVVVEIVGRIVFGAECQQIEWLISDLLSQDEKKIIFDVSGVSLIDSTGVGIIVMCFGKLKKAPEEICALRAPKAPWQRY
jgi:anti-anti-sigma regulatory factor